MDAKTILKEREELIDNAYNFRHNKRVPLMSHVDTWKYLDAGYKFSEILYDYDLIQKVHDDFHEKYQFDMYMSLGTRNNMKTADSLGGGFHKINETDDGLIVHDHNLMETSDYELLLKNPAAFNWSVAFKNFCKPGITLSELVKAEKEFREFQAFSQLITRRFIDVHGTMVPFARGTGIPIETFFRSLRGIRKLSQDIRKYKNELKEIFDRDFAESEPGLKKSVGADYKGASAPLGRVMLAHSILNEKQFEELYWPYLKRIIDIVVENDQKLFIFVESSIGRLAEFFQDIPKGRVLMLIEQDDIFELRKKLPNIALAGGMPSELLGYGTKERCVDYAKKLIDTLGEGFVISQDKIVSYRNDAKAENLLAVNDFVRNYNY